MQHSAFDILSCTWRKREQYFAKFKTTQKEFYINETSFSADYRAAEEHFMCTIQKPDPVATSILKS